MGDVIIPLSFCWGKKMESGGVVCLKQQKKSVFSGGDFVYLTIFIC